MSMSRSDQLVAVRWRDPRVDQANAYTREEIQTRHVPSFTTIGLLVRDDADVVGLATEYGEDGTYRGVTYIMRSLVQEVTPITTWPKRQRRPKAEAPSGAQDAAVRDGGDPRQ